MLSTIDEGYGHLVGVTPLQLWIAVDINNRVSLAGIGADGSHLSNRLVAQVATLPGKYDDSLCPFSQLDHATIIHDAGDVSSEDRRDPRPIKLTASRPAPAAPRTNAGNCASSSQATTSETCRAGHPFSPCR
jgi:hypothetical protein